MLFDLDCDDIDKNLNIEKNLIYPIYSVYIILFLWFGFLLYHWLRRKRQFPVVHRQPILVAISMTCVMVWTFSFVLPVKEHRLYYDTALFNLSLEIGIMFYVLRAVVFCFRAEIANSLHIDVEAADNLYEVQSQPNWFAQNRWLLRPHVMGIVTIPFVIMFIASILLDKQAYTLDTDGSCEKNPKNCNKFMYWTFIGTTGFFSLVYFSVILRIFHATKPDGVGLKEEFNATFFVGAGFLIIVNVIDTFEDCFGLSWFAASIFWFLFAYFVVVKPLVSSRQHEQDTKNLSQFSKAQLITMLRDQRWYQSVLAFLQSELSQENLMFWDELQALRKSLEQESDKLADEDNTDVQPAAPQFGKPPPNSALYTPLLSYTSPRHVSVTNAAAKESKVEESCNFSQQATKSDSYVDMVNRIIDEYIKIGAVWEISVSYYVRQTAVRKHAELSLSLRDQFDQSKVDCSNIKTRVEVDIPSCTGLRSRLHQGGNVMAIFAQCEREALASIYEAVRSRYFQSDFYKKLNISGKIDLDINSIRRRQFEIRSICVSIFVTFLPYPIGVLLNILL
jgi:hypothetical protein